MKEMKDMILQQNETVLQREIARAASETAEIERSLQQLWVDAGTELSEGSQLGYEERFKLQSSPVGTPRNIRVI
jgi:hypothetical protein